MQFLHDRIVSRCQPSSTDVVVSNACVDLKSVIFTYQFLNIGNDELPLYDSHSLSALPVSILP